MWIIRAKHVEMAKWMECPLDIQEVHGLSPNLARVGSEDPLCVSDIEGSTSMLTSKTHGWSQLNSKTESTSGSTKLWLVTTFVLNKRHACLFSGWPEITAACPLLLVREMSGRQACVAAEYNPPHSITLCYDHTAKHYLGGKLLVIIKLNCTEIIYPKSANTAEKWSKFMIYDLWNCVTNYHKDKHTLFLNVKVNFL